ncbi:high mobility group nucleosome-binding domain-containing protein 5 [Prunus yedoensis var. nudiflora]|uniref:High mobility group nucleosome-binding domain-containing protein 5 n=1 Tax=Prunus yedoensis var. nudiflora TaxID=2094558 RepID=A0A314ZLF4_PRUYE|nr:high mobility group nucleosome-binding domain-containing protein 5 [Prunus yedoensis var. nudiflora]
MATDSKSKSTSAANKSKKGKQRYLPYNKAVKKKGSYPLHPGVQGFFITCDGGRERQASNEAINVIDSFYEELVHGKGSGLKLSEDHKPSNKKIKFSYSDSSSSDDDDDHENKQEGEDKAEEEQENGVDEENKSDTRGDDASHENPTTEKSDHQKKDDASQDNATTEKSDHHKKDDGCDGNKTEEKIKDNKEDNVSKEISANEAEEPPAKKQCLGTNSSKCTIPYEVEEKSIDKLIEAELQELGDKNKRRFISLDSGCNGVVFVQMRKRDGDPSPKDIVQHMMASAAATRRHMSRFILRVLPIEVACYSSEEDISRAIKPLLAQHFPVETQNPQKFAVLYEARANTGIDRMKIINAVAKSVPGPHKVDLNNPDKTIVVEIVKTICLIGVVDKYKELAKYNLRQLTSPKP